MIKSFKHKGLKEFFFTGSKKGVQPAQAKRIERILDRLDAAKNPQDMNLPGFDFHGLIGDKAGSYTVGVSGNWRMTFNFDAEDATAVDYLDYH